MPLVVWCVHFWGKQNIVGFPGKYDRIRCRLSENNGAAARGRRGQMAVWLGAGGATATRDGDTRRRHAAATRDSDAAGRTRRATRDGSALSRYRRGAQQLPKPLVCDVSSPQNWNWDMPRLKPVGWRNVSTIYCFVSYFELHVYCSPSQAFNPVVVVNEWIGFTINDASLFDGIRACKDCANNCI